MAEAERRKWRGLGRGALAQEAEQERRPAGRGVGVGAAASALQEQGQGEQETEVAHWYIDQDLVDDYLSVPHVTTIHDILSRMDPRYDEMVIRSGIEHGGYRTALEKLRDPPPHHPQGIHVVGYRARMLERLGRYEQAEALYRGVVKELPGSPAAHLDMARVLEHLGRREESAAEVARAGKFIPDYRRAFEAGMHPDPRQLDPAAVPLRLIIPMSVISAAGTVRSRAELSAASLLVQSECGLDLYPTAASRLPGCAGLGADMGRFYHLVVEDIISYPTGGEPTYYYDLTDRGIDMVRELGERADGSEGGSGAASARIAASARRIAGLGAHAILEEACRAASARVGRERTGRAEALAGLQGTGGRIIGEIGNGIAFGGNHAAVLETKARRIPDMLSQASDAPDVQWDVAAALGGDILGLCARIAFDRRPHPRSYALGPPYPDIRDLYELLVGYCRDRGIAEPRIEVSKFREPAPEKIEEIRRDMLKVIAGS